MTIGMFITGFIIAFIKGWLMALVVVAAVPVIGIAGTIYMIALEKKEKSL